MMPDPNLMEPKIEKERREGDALTTTPLAVVAEGAGAVCRPQRRRGMLFPTKYNGLAAESPEPSPPTTVPPSTRRGTAAEEVGSRYPHRRPQIRRLCATLSATMRQSVRSSGDDVVGEGRGVYVPAPIFVTGPGGSGKTCVVRDALRELTSRCDAAAPVARAYVDCACVESASIGEVLDGAFGQLVRSFSSRVRTAGAVKRRKRGRQARDLGRSEKHLPPQIGGSLNARDAAAVTLNDSNQNSLAPGCIAASHDPPVSSTNRPCSDQPDTILSTPLPLNTTVLEKAEDDDGTVSTDEEELFDEDMIEEQKKRHLKRRRVTRSSPSSTMPALPPGSMHHRDSRSTPYNLRHTGDQPVAHVAAACAPDAGVIRYTLKTPAAFGRAITPFCGYDKFSGDGSLSVAGGGGCAFLVLDHAERLLSMTARETPTSSLVGLSSATTAGEVNNYLSQLLLLPKVMELNLTVIVVTSHVLLEYSREFMLFGLTLSLLLFVLLLTALLNDCLHRLP